MTMIWSLLSPTGLGMNDTARLLALCVSAASHKAAGDPCVSDHPNLVRRLVGASFTFFNSDHLMCPILCNSSFPENY